MIIMTAACFTISALRLLLNRVISLRPLDMETVAKKTTASVDVLMPPAVEPGLPPINMSIMDKRLPDSDRVAVSMVLKPAVLVVTDIKAEESSLLERDNSSRFP